MVLLIHKIWTELEHRVLHNCVIVLYMSTCHLSSYLFSYIFRHVGRIAKTTIIFDTSVCLSAWNNSAPTGRISMIYDTRTSFENLSRKFNFL